MRYQPFVFLVILILTLSSCKSEHLEKKPLFEIILNAKNITKDSRHIIALRNKENLTIERVVYTIDKDTLAIKNDSLQFAVTSLGNKVLTATVFSNGETHTATKKIKVLNNKAPQIYTYTVINEFKHDPNSYTQGLEFSKDILYEGTGKRGKSVLRAIDYKTGAIIREVPLDASYFGEGITIMDSTIYQLTWQSKVGFMYDLASMEKRNNFQYGKSVEGWGLANDGTKLYKSDGTEKIWFLNKDTLKEEGHIEITTNTAILNKANELEYHNGKLYANVYQKPSVMIIDSKTGALDGVVNFGGLSKRIKKPTNWNPKDQVLNGIAYHKGRNTFFVTGKEWDVLFEVQIHKKQ